jgi:hypothetical protein
MLRLDGQGLLRTTLFVFPALQNIGVHAMNLLLMVRIMVENRQGP